MDDATHEYEEAIYIRRNGGNVRISRQEWDALYPGREPVTVIGGETDEVFWANITHNLGGMADEAWIYHCLWRPDEVGLTKAAQLIEPLREGLNRLRAEPAKYKALNPKNGWGDYDGLVRFVTEYLEACEKYPNAKVEVSR
jgi:hypothetical protein